MSDVFISYSRRDSPFVRKLYDALRERDLDVWVDFEGIPPSAEWRQEIASAIQGADAFVFVLSPDSAASKVCGEELAEALKYQKRLIPVVRRTVGSKDVAPELAKLNWVYFREEDDEVKALGLVVDAIRTDLPWVKMHTRLLTRALEWEANRREGGYLLRGKDLADAEAWLGGAAGKDPPPQAVQAQYILASRALATRRTRALLGAITMALVVSVGLTVYALVQRSRAITEARIALSRQLAVQSAGLTREAPDVALLLAADAFRRHDSPETRGALLGALQEKPRLAKYLSKPGAGLDSVSFHPGAGMFAATVNGIPALFDAQTGKRLRLFEGLPAPVRSLTLGPSGLITEQGDGSIDVWDTGSGEKKLHLNLNTGGVANSITFSATGTVLAAASSAGPAQLWRLPSGHEMATLANPALKFGQGDPLSAGVLTLAVSPDSATLFVADLLDNVFAWDLNTLQPRAIVTNREVVEGDRTIALAHTPIKTFAFDSSSRRVAIVARQGTWVSDLETGELVTLPDTQSVRSAAFSPDGRLLALGTGDGRDGQILFWDIAGKTQRGLALDGGTLGVTSLAFSADGSHLFAAYDDGSAQLWDLRTVVGLSTHAATRPPDLDHIALRPDGSLAGWNFRDSTLQDLTRQAPIPGVGMLDPEFAASVAGPNGPALGFSPDGSLFAAVTRDGLVYVWDTSSGKRSALLKGVKEASAPKWIDVRSGRLAVGFVTRIALWDLASQEQLGTLPIEPAPVTQAALSPDGRMVAWASLGWGYGIWDSGKPGAPGVAKADSRIVTSMAFGPDGNSLFVATDDGRVTNVDTRTLEPVASAKGPSIGARHLSVTPEGSFLAGAFGNDIFLWDAPTLVLLEAPLAGDHPVDDLLATEDALIAMYGYDAQGIGTIARWDLDPKTWSAKACQVANRELTAAEWKQYVGKVRQEPVCGGTGQTS